MRSCLRINQVLDAHGFWYFWLPAALEMNRFFSPTVIRPRMGLSFGTQRPECVSYLNTL